MIPLLIPYPFAPEVAAAPSATEGELNVTLDDATLDAAGVKTIRGVVDVTLDDATLDAVGASTAGIQGQLNVTLDDATLDAAGVKTIRAILDAALDAATLEATGIGPAASEGSLVATLGDATLLARGVLTPIPPEGGGGPGRRRGWAAERQILEESLRRAESDDISRITAVMVQAEQPRARRIARKLVDYTGEVEQVESLRRDLQRLESAQVAREGNEQKLQDLRAAAAELQQILRDDEETMAALNAVAALESRLVLAALGMGAFEETADIIEG